LGNITAAVDAIISIPNTNKKTGNIDRRSAAQRDPFCQSRKGSEINAATPVNANGRSAENLNID
jgi:hypothetical protein